MYCTSTNSGHYCLPDLIVPFHLHVALISLAALQVQCSFQAMSCLILQQDEALCRKGEMGERGERGRERGREK